MNQCTKHRPDDTKAAEKHREHIDGHGKDHVLADDSQRLARKSDDLRQTLDLVGHQADT